MGHDHTLFLVSYFLLFCWPTVNSQGLFCDDISNCVEGSVCTNHTCHCTDGKIFNTDYTQCLTVALAPKYDCVDSKQCEWIVGPSECNKNKCSCQSGYRYSHDKCIIARDLYFSCNENDECYNYIDSNAMKCENNMCMCNDGYYVRNNTDCRKSANNGYCIIDLDCQSKKCENNRCIKDLDIIENAETNLKNKAKASKQDFDIKCKDDLDCQNVNNSICIGIYQKCMCKPYFTYNSKVHACVPAIGETCENTDTVCPKYAKCNPTTLKCECEDYYINGVLNEICYKPVKQIHGSCNDDRNCYTLGRYAVCLQQECKCSSLSQYDEEFMLCVPVSSEASHNCKTNQDCEESGNVNTVCINQECICNENSTYNEIDNLCLSNLGFQCKYDSQCFGENVKCVQQKCVCSPGYIEETSNTCIKEIENKNESCKIDAQCAFLLGEGGVCNNSKCECNKNYKLINDTCFLVKYLGDSCTSLMACKVTLQSEMVRCLNGKCVCEYGYKIGDEKTECVPGGAVSVFPSVTLITGLICLAALMNLRKNISD